MTLLADVSFNLTDALLSTAITILLAGIPWAYSIHGRLTGIEASLKGHDDLREQVGDHEKRIITLEQHRTR